MTKATKTNKNTHEASLLTYTAGFVLSIMLTLAAYISVTEKLFSGWALVYAITALAITQLIVQAIFFLHLGDEKKPRFNLMTFIFTALVVAILVIGSLWIMKNLDYNMMPKQQEEYMLDQYDKGGF